MPENIKERAHQEVNNAFTDLIDSTLDKLPSSKLEKDKAIAIVTSLAIEVESIEKRLDNEIKSMINEEVYKKGSDILHDYKHYIAQLKEELSIEDFNFEKIKDLKKFDFKNLKDAARRVTSTEDIMQKKTKNITNPNRHWFTPWRPKTVEITCQEKVGTIEYVDKSVVRDDIISIRTNALENVEEIIREANVLMESFKKFFEKQLIDFDKVINSVINELSIATSDDNMAKIIQKQHKESQENFEKYLTKIKSITDIKEK